MKQDILHFVINLIICCLLILAIDLDRQIRNSKVFTITI